MSPEDGGIVALGKMDSGVPCLTRFVGGVADFGFGFKGHAAVPLDTTNALALGVDGSFVVAGRRNGRFALIRIRRNGEWDRHFGDHGFAQLPDDRPSDALTIEADVNHRLVAGGYVENEDGTTDAIVVRFWL